jgi:hypothetical protein
MFPPDSQNLHFSRFCFWQVHKEEVTEVPNSLPGREDITLKIFGMAGVPLDGIAERNGEGELAESRCLLQSVEIARTLEK